jgi:hypothetical protein
MVLVRARLTFPLCLTTLSISVSSVARSGCEHKRRLSKHDDFNDDFGDFAPASALTALNDV